MSKRGRGLAVSVLLALLTGSAGLAGCASVSDGSAADPPAGVSAGASVGPNASVDPNTWDPEKMPSPCRTVGSAQLSAITGRSAGQGQRLNSWPPQCEFMLDKVTFLRVSDNPLTPARLEFDQARNSGELAKPISGIGTEAYWLPTSTELHAMVAAVHVRVQFAGPGIPSSSRALAQAEAIMRIVVTNLKKP